MSNTKLAAPELAAVEVQGMTRHAFMARSAIAAGTVYGLADGRAVRASGDGSGGRRRRRHPELRAHARVPRGGVLRPGPQAGRAGSAARRRRSPPRCARTRISTSRRSRPRSRTSAARRSRRRAWTSGMAFADEKSFLKTAQTFEDLGVSAYNGAAPAIESKEVLAAAGGIVQVEARHAAAIRSLRGVDVSRRRVRRGARPMDEVLDGGRAVHQVLGHGRTARDILPRRAGRRERPGQDLPRLRVRGGQGEDPRVRARGRRGQPRLLRPRRGEGGRLPRRAGAADVRGRLLRGRDGPGHPRPRGGHQLPDDGPRRAGVRLGRAGGAPATRSPPPPR